MVVECKRENYLVATHAVKPLYHASAYYYARIIGHTYMTVVEFTNRSCVLMAFWRVSERCDEMRGDPLPHVSHLVPLDLIFFQFAFTTLWKRVRARRVT